MTEQEPTVSSQPVFDPQLYATTVIANEGGDPHAALAIIAHAQALKLSQRLRAVEAAGSQLELSEANIREQKRLIIREHLPAFLESRTVGLRRLGSSSVWHT